MTKVGIVTGASRGMGYGIAKVLAEEEGATVYATARSKQALDDLSASTKDSLGVIHPFVLDQADAGAVESFVLNVKAEELNISNRKFLNAKKKTNSRTNG